MSDQSLSGYHGKILEIDLSTRSARTRPLKSETAVHYLGGRGLATRIFVDEVDPGCEPLSGHNALVIAVAPLVGTNAPTACRGHMVFKSPLTGIIGSSNCGGSWAPVFKATGHDVLVIKGQADEPVWIDLAPGKIEILPARDLWGLDVHETTDKLLADVEKGTRSRVLCIVPAGENQVRFASVMNDKNRAYGRSGPGAVWGAKNLKAVRVSGKEKVAVRDEDKYKSGLDQARYLMKAAPGTKNLFRELGTAGLIRLIDVIDMLPHRNFQDNLHDELALDGISGEAIRDNTLERAGAC